MIWFITNADMTLFALIISISLVFSQTHFLLSRAHPATRSVNYSFACGITLSLISYVYYLSLIFKIQYEFLLGGLIVISVCSFMIIFRKANTIQNPFKDKVSWKFWMLITSILILTVRFDMHRWGEWDAWAIWSLHAKFLYDPEFWSNLFSAKLSPTHPDYPLMLPALIAFLWKGIGYTTPVVPIAFANLVLVLVPVTVFAALDRFKSPFFGILSIVIFILDTKFIRIAGSQYADTLLAFFILLTFVVYHEVKRSPSLGMFIVLGIMAASTTWIKNEGLLFFLVFSCPFLFFYRKKLKSILGYLSGCVLPVLVLVHFKTTLAPKNDLINSDRGSKVMEMLVSPERYALIIKYLVLTTFEYYWILLVLLAIMLIFRIAFIKTLPFWVVSGLLLGYFLIYLITPNDLNWHLGASVDRLLHHIYPACLYLLLFKLSSVWQPVNMINNSPLTRSSRT